MEKRAAKQKESGKQRTAPDMSAAMAEAKARK